MSKTNRAFVLHAAGKSVLSPCFVYDNGNAVGQVETPVIGSHRKPGYGVFPEKTGEFRGKALLFGTENKGNLRS